MNLQEFLKEKRAIKKIILPHSKLEVEIRKITESECVTKFGFLFIEKMQTLGARIQEKAKKNVSSASDVDEMLNSMNKICVMGCVTPQLVSIDTKNNSELYINFLEQSDLAFLYSEIMLFSKQLGDEEVAEAANPLETPKE